LDAEGYETLSAQFSYSAEDERDDRPNPSPISIDGNLRNGLASLKQALRLYDRFRSNDPSKDSHDAFVNQLTRAEIEDAMDAFDGHQEGIEHNPLFEGFGKPTDYWVRSTRNREPRIYPTKPIVGFRRH